MAMEKAAVYILDDHEIFLTGVRVMLERSGLASTVKSFLNLSELYDAAKNEKPDLIIADQMLGQGTGAEAVLKLRELYPDLRAIIVSSARDRLIKEVCERNSIQGYIVKSEPEKKFLFSVREVLLNRKSYPDFSESSDISDDRFETVNPFSKLTKRELELVRHLANGLQMIEIAKEMGISQKTADNHRRSITEKIGKVTTVQLVRQAYLWGVVREEVMDVKR
ncbi:MAG TPA: response regulator transcription factor [Leptospiraceae bacterium]|nr:response regulator transcription factor [Leptospiraceae bacterium]HNF16435.1 response regulator transcription factor [Leptospiraceae bacterium]HNF25857.1 response regulator transcription factor [Leptospiraceae bacterium]HNI26496.1 response regulator transcription factor [Leptospiraceae bacterium]HNI98518.1 response regulator transcription factor [Leptospiraceae bacterium]